MTILRNVWLNQFCQRRYGPAISRLDGEDGPVEEAIETSKSPVGVLCEQIGSGAHSRSRTDPSIEFREVILLREYEELSASK